MSVLEEYLELVRAATAEIESLRSRPAESKAAAKTWENEAERRSRRYEKAATRLAEADALIAKGLAVVHDFLPNIGRCVLQDYQRMNEFCSEAAARTAVSADGGEK